MEPGDVLYVPKHWWHYVICVDTAVSVNSWIELVSVLSVSSSESMVYICYRRVIHKTD